MPRWEPESRERLQEAALALYGERGYDATTVAEIAARAGLTERTYFRYFADKREVLFWGAATLQEHMVAAVVAAPASAGPLDAVAVALDAGAAMFADRRAASGRRHAILAANVELQERELIKLASLAAALADGLRQRGVSDLTAGVAAEAGVAVFKTAFERWVDPANHLDLAAVMQVSLDELRSVASGAMPEHGAHRVERTCDVAVVGGSAAGLAAALQLGRQRRAVIVIDADEPRNAPASHMHGYLSRDGAGPAELAALGREEVRSYGGEVLSGHVQRVAHGPDGRFRLELAGGHTVVARRVLAATGLVDELPAIEGLAEQWGRGVIHCPFCHGYEARDQRIVQIVTHPMGLHPAALFRQLSTELTVVVDPAVEVDESALQGLTAGGVDVRRAQVRRIVTGDDGQVASVELADRSVIGADVVAVGPRFGVRADPFAPLGLRSSAHPSGLGDFVETDPSGETHVAGLYAAGNVADPAQQVLQAAAAGSWVGGMIAFSLAGEDLRAAARPSAREADWDDRYGEADLWSGNPNGSLVAEVGDLPPGHALDVGAGEGGDALWLAEQGWTVTATDISAVALTRISAGAAQRALTVECRAVDANAPDAFGSGGYDLVTAHYASIPRTPDDRAARNLVGAVAPGGVLLVVGHDLADAGDGGRAFDPDAYVRVSDVATLLATVRGWDIEVSEVRHRPAGAASGGHHVNDVILRARRRSS